MISVIIPTCDRNDLLSKCLDQLDPKNQVIEANYEVIVTDDNKDNKAKKLTEEFYPWVKWIEGPKKGPAANRNNGANHVNGDWLIFIDDDCLPDKNILNCYKDAIINNPDILAFEGAVLPDDWGKLNEDMSECPINTVGGYFWSANICVNRTIFQQIHGFDEKFLIAAQEDQDIYIRILAKTKVVFIGEAIVVHPVRRMSLKKKISKIPIVTKNWYIYEKKHNTQTISRILTMCIKFSIVFMIGTVKNLMKGKVKTSIYLFLYFWLGMPVYLTLSIKNHING
jgi:GT2 family glycosyltransferase